MIAGDSWDSYEKSLATIVALQVSPWLVPRTSQLTVAINPLILSRPMFSGSLCSIVVVDPLLDFSYTIHVSFPPDVLKPIILHHPQHPHLPFLSTLTVSSPSPAPFSPSPSRSSSPSPPSPSFRSPSPSSASLAITFSNCDHSASTEPNSSPTYVSPCQPFITPPLSWRGSTNSDDALQRPIELVHVLEDVFETLGGGWVSVGWDWGGEGGREKGGKWGGERGRGSRWRFRRGEHRAVAGSR